MQYTEGRLASYSFSLKHLVTALRCYCFTLLHQRLEILLVLYYFVIHCNGMHPVINMKQGPVFIVLQINFNREAVICL